MTQRSKRTSRLFSLRSAGTRGATPIERATLCALLALAMATGACAPLPAEAPKETPGDTQKDAGKNTRNDSGNSAASPAEACAKISFPPDRRVCLEKEFDQADRKLNALYKKLRAKLREPVRGDLKENSLGWIRMKEYNCEFQSEMMQNATNDARLAAFYRCTLDYTLDRIQYLKRAFGREGVTAGLAGEYDDGFAGGLEFRRTGNTKNAYKFRIDVVRGPTAHIGEIEGEVFLKNDETAVYTDQPNCKMEVEAEKKYRGLPCCRLDFQLKNHGGFRTIAVKETNCGDYHGARAYFDGLYRKIK